MEQFKGIIYQAINIQNRKSYIGQTVQDFDYYLKNHISQANLNNNNRYFYNAIRNYGAHNFK